MRFVMTQDGFSALARSLILTLLVSGLVASPSQAQMTTVAPTALNTLSAVQAHERAQAGEVTLIDTGVAQGVKRVSMRQPGGGQAFAQAIFDAAGKNLDAPIVLICRTGSRTSRLVPLLKEMGFTNVVDVPEGMLGSRAGPGWIARGLPVDPCQNC
uniref:rhodanese-like domain-containing protein n=1 Tax=Orrella sp. TaxID=1921583 RepID=UPI0040555F08